MASQDTFTQLESVQLADLLHQAPTPLLLMTGPEHCFSFINASYARLLRRSSPEDMLGNTVRENLPELEGQGFFEILDTVYQTGEPYFGHQVPCELINDSTGEVEHAYFDFIYKPFRDEGRNIAGVMAQATDVTLHITLRNVANKRQEQIEHERRQLAEMYRTAPVGFALYEPKEFRLLSMNQKFAEMLDMTEEQLLGRSVLEFAGNIQGVRDRFQKVADGGTVEGVVIQGELESQPGRYRSWIVNYSPIFAIDGTVQTISTVSVDITAQKRAEQALLQSEKLSAVGRLASSIAHEINNPLESVTNLLYLVQMNTTNPEQQRYLDLAEQELRRVSNIASQTLRFHRQQSAPTVVEIASLFSSLLSVYEGRLRNSGIAVTQSAHLGVSILSMESDIRQVLSNLVGNAIDAMPLGGRLELRARDTHDWKTMQPGVAITVADTGSGMDARTQERVFDAFFTTKGIGGTGLGLWISSDIVKRLGGRISLRSSNRDRAHGTVITLFLPAPATN